MLAPRPNLALRETEPQMGWTSGCFPMGARFSDDPSLFFDFHVFVCTNRRPDNHPRGSCAARGSEKLRDYMKARAKELGLARVRINTSQCLDRCELGPCIVVYPEGIWYRVDSPEAVDLVLEKHLREGGRAGELMLDR
jgi:(2Fe-2S) ferredoxin